MLLLSNLYIPILVLIFFISNCFRNLLICIISIEPLIKNLNKYLIIVPANKKRFSHNNNHNDYIKFTMNFNIDSYIFFNKRK